MGSVTALRASTDPALERMLGGWLCFATPAQVVTLAERLNPDLCVEATVRACVRAVQARLVAGQTWDLPTLSSDVRAMGHPQAATTLSSWYVEWSDLRMDGAAILDALEDAAALRLAQAIKAMPDAPTGRAALEEIAARLAQAPDPNRGATLVSAMEAGAETARHLTAEAPRRLRTNLRPLDEALGGFRPGELVVVGARPGGGKSVLAWQIALGMLQAEGRPVLYHSLEMGRVEMVCRQIAAMTSIENWRVQRAALTPFEQEQALQANMQFGLETRGLSFVKLAGVFSEHQALYERWITENPTGACLVVDYLGLLRGSGRQERRYLELGAMTHALKAFALNHQCVVIAVSQLNRQPVGNDRQPELHDLRESGDIEQDADVVMLLHQHDPEHESPQTDVLVKKNRSGRLGSFPLRFEKPFCRFVEDEVQP